MTDIPDVPRDVPPARTPLFHDVATPVLVVDVDVLHRNLVAMADATAGAGVALRPHAKTHKCPQIAHRQLTLGAVGLSVATVAEAEVFADHGVTDLFVAYPVAAGGGRAARLAALLERARVVVGVDSVEGAAALGPVRATDGRTPEALVEVDCGLHRSGVAPEEAPVVAVAAARAGLRVTGAFTYPGHAYAPGAAASAAADERAALARAGELLAAAGFDVTVLSGGSTPTATRTAADPGPCTELRPGVYAFNDAQQVHLGTCGPGDVALRVLATVVSAPAPDRVVLDAGTKVLGADRPPWAPGHGSVPGLPGAVVTGLWEHHAVVRLAPQTPRPAVGEVVAVVPNHCCSAVNLVDELVVVRDGHPVDRWPVAARGANT